MPMPTSYSYDPDADDPGVESDEHDDDAVEFEDEAPPEPDPDEDEDDEDEDDDEDHAADVTDDETDGNETASDDGIPVPSGRKREWVPLGDLVLEYKFWTNPRKFTGLDEAKIRALADDIVGKSSTTEEGTYAGIDDPLLVVKIASNGGVVLLVLDGQRRFNAVEIGYQGGDSTEGADSILVPVAYREPEPVQWSEALARKYLREAVSNASLREGLSAFELSESAELLRGTKDLDSGKELTIADIARSIGRSESWVSKILIARKNASPKLLHRWAKGELTEEQFRDLAAAAAGDEAEQERQAQKVKTEAASGNKGEARRAAKEAAELKRQVARDERAAKKEAKKAAKEAKRAAKQEAQKDKGGKGKGKKGKGGAGVVSGPQAELPIGKDKEAPKPAKPKALPSIAIDDLLDQVKRHPPTNDLVKGIVLGIQVASGRLDFDGLPPAWGKYITHLHGKSDKRSK